MLYCGHEASRALFTYETGELPVGRSSQLAARNMRRVLDLVAGIDSG